VQARTSGAANDCRVRIVGFDFCPGHAAPFDATWPSLVSGRGCFVSGSVAIRITRGRVPTNCRTCQPLPAEPDDPRWVSGRDIEEHKFRLMLGSVPATREQPRLVSDRNTHVLSPAVQFNHLGFPDQPVRWRHPFRVAELAPGCQPSGTPSVKLQQFSPRRALSTLGFLRYRRNDRRQSEPLSRR
jgi:hypothetical protein